MHVHGLRADRRGGQGRGGSPADDQSDIGQSVRSKEAPRLVSGRGRYVDDLSLPRMLHALRPAQSLRARSDSVRAGDDAARLRVSAAS